MFVDGQKRRVTKAIRRLMKRWAAVEPVIGHLKAEHRMGRNCLAHRMGDAINAILAAVGYNFRLLRRFIAQLLLRLIQICLFGLAQRCQTNGHSTAGLIVHVRLIGRHSEAAVPVSADRPRSRQVQKRKGCPG